MHIPAPALSTELRDRCLGANLKLASKVTDSEAGVAIQEFIQSSGVVESLVHPRICAHSLPKKIKGLL